MSQTTGKPFMPSLGNSPMVTPAAPEPVTREQFEAAAKAEMDTYTGESRDVDPDAQGESALTQEQRDKIEKKPKVLPDKATSVEEDNAKQTPAVVDGPEDEDEDEDADEGDGDEETPDGEEEAPPKTTAEDVRRRARAAERYRAMERSRGEANRRAEAAEARAESLERRLTALERGEKPPKTNGAGDAGDKDDGRPDASKFKYGEIDPEYIAAVVSYETDKRLKEADEKREAAAQEERRAARIAELEGMRDTMAERGVAEYGESYMETVIQAAIDKKFAVSPVMALLTFESEVGHKIAHHLATHPKEAREVAGKSDYAQAAYFGRLEERFLSTVKKADATVNPKPEAPQVPNPPRHKARGAGGQFTVTADTPDFAAFEAMATQQQRRS